MGHRERAPRELSCIRPLSGTPGFFAPKGSEIKAESQATLPKYWPSSPPASPSHPC